MHFRAVQNDETGAKRRRWYISVGASQMGVASNTFNSVAELTTRPSSKPVLARSFWNCDSERSLPANVASVSKSNSLAKDGVLPGGTIYSRRRRRPLPPFARRILFKMTMHLSSGQSCSTCLRRY